MTRRGPILAATDFSAPARHAADRAARLAHKTGAALTLMHVLPGGALQELRQWLGTGHAMEQHLRDDAHRQLRQLLAELQTRLHVAIRPLNPSGSALDEIGCEAEALDATLAVLGARGTGCMHRLVLGSTSERLLRRTTGPCWWCGRHRTNPAGESSSPWTSRPGRHMPSLWQDAWRRTPGCCCSTPTRSRSRESSITLASTPRPSIATGNTPAQAPRSECTRWRLPAD